MTDSITPTGAPPPPPMPAAKDTAVIRNAPVISAPTAAQPPADGKTIALRAVVIEDNSLPPDHTRLRTDKGDVVIRSDTRLPPDTEVMVDIQRQKAAMIAQVRVMQRSAEMQPPAPQPTTPSPPPAPPVMAGDRLIALILSGSVPQPATTPPPVSSEAAAAIKQLVVQMMGSGTAAKFPVPLSTLTAIAGSATPATVINALPADQQTALRALLPQPATPAMAIATPAAALPATDSDDGLLNVLKAATSARLTEQAVTNAPSGGSNPLGTLVKNMLPLIQGLQAQGMTQTPGTPLMQAAAAPQTGAELKIISVLAPKPDGTPQNAPVVGNGQLLGQVIGHTKDGMAVIKTSIADFVLSTRANLPVGTTLLMQATPLGIQELAARLTPAAGALFAGFNPLSDSSWPALDEAMQILAHNKPAAAANLANTLPSPGPKMVPTTLFFLAAIRLGMVENWLGGQTMQALRDSGARATADKLGGDFTRIGRQATEPLSGEWRGISLPILHDSQLSQIQLFVRKQREDDSTAPSGGKTTRFLLNLQLSKLGGMQLDGLMHEGSAQKPAEKRLDMVIRSDQRLTPGIMQDLQTAYTTGLRDSKMTGSLQFQVNRQGWVEVDHRTPGSREA